MDVEELFELEEELKEELKVNLTGILTKLNRDERLEDLLSLLGLEHLLQKNSGYSVQKSGKIIVIGKSEVKPDILLAIGEKFGISKDRFELYLEYEDAKTFNFKKMQWQPIYSVVLAGPMPHSGKAKGEYASIISAIENEDGYPPVIRLGTNELKITKSDFKQKLRYLLDDGKLSA